jgi:hypothetical protein
MRYYWGIEGPSTNEPVPVNVFGNLLAIDEGSFLAFTHAEATIRFDRAEGPTTFTASSTGSCSDDAQTDCLGEGGIIGEPGVRVLALPGDIHYIELEASVGVFGAGEAIAMVDPVIEIDPGFADRDQYRLVLVRVSGMSFCRSLLSPPLPAFSSWARSY